MTKVRVLQTATTMVGDYHVSLNKDAEVELPAKIANALIKAGTVEAVAPPAGAKRRGPKPKAVVAEDKKIAAAPENKGA